MKIKDRSTVPFHVAKGVLLTLLSIICKPFLTFSKLFNFMYVYRACAELTYLNSCCTIGKES